MLETTKVEKVAANQVELEKVEIHTVDKDQTRIEVALSLNGRREIVEKITLNNDEAILMATGLATIDAIRLLVPRLLDCQINYIKQVESKSNTPSRLQCLLSLRDSGKETLLNGNITITNSVYKAVADSILVALSNTLERMIELQQRKEKINRTRDIVKCLDKGTTKKYKSYFT